MQIPANILRKYGIKNETETVSEYAGVEKKEKGDLSDVMYDIRGCMDAALSIDNGHTTNPWFTDRQIAVLENYMDGDLATRFLTAERKPLSEIANHDVLLAYLLAACDPNIGNHAKNFMEIAELAKNPAEAIRDNADQKNSRDDEVLVDTSWTREELREFIEDNSKIIAEHPDLLTDDLVKSFAETIESAMLEACDNIDIDDKICQYVNYPGLKAGACM